jgi:hypothetical protein
MPITPAPFYSRTCQGLSAVRDQAPDERATAEALLALLLNSRGEFEAALLPRRTAWRDAPQGARGCGSTASPHALAGSGSEA